MQRQTISKALLATVAGSLFALGASPAFAQDTADLTVKGSIVPAACSANFTGGDTVDFGTIKVVDLLPNSYNPLGTKTTALNVTCSSNKQVHIAVNDAQHGSAILDTTMQQLLGRAYLATSGFGLGKAAVGGNPNSVELGTFVIKAPAPTVDGAVQGLLYSPPGSTAYLGGGANRDLEPANLGGGRWYSAGRDNGAVVATGMNFIYPLEITAALNKGSALQVAQDTPLNGQAVFTIRYE